MFIVNNLLSVSIVFMELKHVFIQNLKKIRNAKGLSQMKLAEFCNVAPNYIAQIESYRRFPSFKLIERMGEVLEVEPYRFFIGDNGEAFEELDQAVDLMAKLPDEIRLSIINRISG
jgi:transcriptional regulator with XRE-family HTH domain